MSFKLLMGMAPSRIRRLVPCEVGLSIGPGMAMTSLPNSRAHLAVIRAPLFRAASTTITQCARAAIIRLRAGNLHGAGGVPKGYSVMIVPYLLICFFKVLCSGGYVISKPLAKTPIGNPFGVKLFLWAIPSIPRAKPLITDTPCDDSRLPILAANESP